MDLSFLKPRSLIPKEYLEDNMLFEIFFIDYETDWSQRHYEKLKARLQYPFIKKIKKDSLENIFKLAAKQSHTHQFWVIDGSVSILNYFNFNYRIPAWDSRYIHTWLTYRDFKICSEGVYTLTKDYDGTYKNFKKFIGYENTDFDIVFISFNEPVAEENYKKLRKHVNRNVHRVHGIKGIHNAHRAAAELVKTDMFWVVDADAEIVPSFKFNYKPHTWDFDQVHIWRSQNPLNNLVYGYGGVKLLPKSLVLSMNASSVDMTTSISNKLKVMNTISNLTIFNTDPFNTWRSAFRECVKLSSSVIDNSSINIKRLDIWCNVANGNHAEDALLGARSGRKYGEENKGNLDALAKINDFDWLQSRWLEERS